MLGAIIGDIAGSAYERVSPPIKVKQFPWFGKGSRFTDDTVTTVAVASALMAGKRRQYGYSILVRQELQYWCRQYPDAGFGRLFVDWFMSDNAAPYGSYGNGAAMRVAPAGWVGQSLDEVQMLAELTAVVSHDNDEAIQGAAAVASAIYLARIGKTIPEIRTYLQQHFYPLDQAIDSICPAYVFTSRTRDSVPEAIEAFLESTSFADAVNTAVSLGGDTDTQAAVAGAIAEAYYGIPDDIAAQAMAYLPDAMQAVVREFRDTYMK